MLLKIGALILAGYALVFGLFCLVALRSGVAIVEVKDHRKGTHIFVPVPMVLGSIGVALMPEHALRSVQRDIGPRQQQVMNAVIDELRNCPDGPFVEVKTSREHVVIEKRGDNLVVNVDGEDEDVYVKLPLRGTKNLMSQLLAAN